MTTTTPIDWTSFDELLAHFWRRGFLRYYPRDVAIDRALIEAARSDRSKVRVILSVRESGTHAAIAGQATLAQVDAQLRGDRDAFVSSVIYDARNAKAHNAYACVTVYSDGAIEAREVSRDRAISLHYDATRPEREAAAAAQRRVVNAFRNVGVIDARINAHFDAIPAALRGA